MAEIVKSENEDTVADSLFDYEVFADSIFGDMNSSKIDNNTANNFSDNQTVNNFSENETANDQIGNFSDIFETRRIDFNIKSNEKGQIEVDISLEKQDGIIIGVVAFALILLQIGIYCYIRRVRKRKR